ncbi:MAG: NAD(P)-dependent oxidoreductase, partial [Reyranella sp.]
MKHLPLFFDLAGRRVVVVGEGAVADRRADLVRSAGAHVQRLAAAPVQAADFRGAVAAFIATGDADHDAAAQRAAKSIGVP